MRGAFSKDYYVALGNAKCETALSNANYPASGSFINVAGYEKVQVVIHLGTLADAVVFTLKQADSVSGTLDTIDSTYCKKTCATTDDGQVLIFELDTDQLTANHHFLSVAVSGVSGSDYADMMWFLSGRHLPVTQGSTVVPDDNILSKVAA